MTAGKTPVPNAPGFGIELDREALERFKLQEGGGDALAHGPATPACRAGAKVSPGFPIPLDLIRAADPYGNSAVPMCENRLPPS
jgi:hypothetical protein